MTSGKRGGGFWLGWPFLLLGMAIAGCSHSGDSDMREKAFTGVVTPHAPTFFTGTAAVLLTNAGSFSARVTVQAEGYDQRERNVSGQLFGRGSKLAFAPETEQAAPKSQHIGIFSFFWDVAENRGFIVSEALQAYAPTSSSLQITNVSISPLNSAPQKLNGHPCESVRATINKADGTSSSFEVLRATDLNRFPMRITSESNSPPLTLTFSKIRLEAPSPDVFAPPEGFSKYASPEAMVDELAARQRNLRRKSHDTLEPFTGYSGSH
jgi:hypothetical protein